MIKPFEQLPQTVTSYKKAIQMAMAESVRQIATVGANTIIDNTPVDTTKAVSNWKVTLGRYGTMDYPPRVAWSRKGSGAGLARFIMKQDAQVSIKAYRGGNVSLWIVNGVPYIKWLEYGGPRNRPYHMVQKGLIAMRERANYIKILDGVKKKAR